MNLLAALLVLTGLAAAADAPETPHTLTVTYANASSSFVKTVSVEKGKQTNFNGMVGSPAKLMVVNAGLAGEEKDRFTVNLQSELTAKRSAISEDTFQLQVSLQMRPGTVVDAVECGGWTVTLALDAPAKTPKKAFNPADLDNGRMTVESGSRKCRYLLEIGAQSNIVDAHTSKSGKKSMVSNSVLTREGTAFRLSYQFEDTAGYSGRADGEVVLLPGRRQPIRNGPSFILEAAKEAPKKAGAPAQTSTSGYGAPSSASPAAPGAAPAAQGPQEGKTVIMLR